MSIVEMYETEFGPFSGQLPEIIAVKEDLKPVSRFRGYDKSEADYLKRICNGKGIKVQNVISSNYRTNARKLGFYTYVSKSNELIERAKEVDPAINKRGSHLELGKLLGYPECCIKNFLKLSESGGGENKYIKRVMDFRLNQFLNTSNFYLISHLPCSYECEETIRYANKMLDLLKSYDKTYTRILKRCMKLPALVSFPSYPKFLDCFDHRDGIVFDGECKGNGINYRDFQRIYTVDSDSLLNDIIDCLHEGDRIEINEGNVVLKDGGETVDELNVKGNINIFRFSNG